MGDVTPNTRSVFEMLYYYHATENNVDGVKACLNHGIQIDRKESFALHDSDGRLIQISSLQLAACHSSVGVVELLLNRFADFKDRGHMGRTAMHMAVLQGSVECVEAFLRFGSDVNTRDSAGMTAINTAMSQNNTEMVRLLLKWDAEFLWPQPEELGWRTWVQVGSIVETILENEEAKVQAFAMGLHQRLGNKSCLRGIDDDLLRMLLGKK
jgi:hypothetical protein